MAWLIVVCLAVTACGGKSPTAPSTAVPGSGASDLSATYTLSGTVHAAGGPAPAGMLVSVPGGPSATLDTAGRFLLPGVPVHSAGLPLRVGQHEVSLGFSSTARQDVYVEIVLDLGVGAARVSRLCISTPPSLNPTPGTPDVSLSMCVGSSSGPQSSASQLPGPARN